MLIRRPVVAGRFYPGDPEALAAEVDGYVGASRARDAAGADSPADAGDSRPRAVMLPHAGYVYCGAVIGAVLAGAELPRTLVLLGPNHTGAGAPLSVWPEGAWLTPLGPVPVDGGLAARIHSRRPFAADVAAHAGEHSLEVLLPFLQRLPGGVPRIVPICVGVGDPDVLRAAGGILADAVRESGEGDVAFVVSSDMNHYESESATLEKDDAALERVLACDPDGLLEVVARRRISMCGAAPMALALSALKSLSDAPLRARLVMHDTSATVSGDAAHCVGYAGVRFA